MNKCRGSDEIGSDYTAERDLPKNQVEMWMLREPVSLSGEWTIVIVNGWVVGYLRDPHDAAAVAGRAVRDPNREPASPSIHR